MGTIIVGHLSSQLYTYTLMINIDIFETTIYPPTWLVIGAIRRLSEIRGFEAISLPGYQTV
jgi:hypothetical protein